MLTVDYAVHRVRGILEEIRNLKDEDFPYNDSRAALDHIELLFQSRLESLLNLTAKDDSDVVKAACSEAFLQQVKFLPLLGFIVRSTNVRNSFELFWPLWRLARQVLGASVKLVLSSEWHFSPHVYPPASDLPNYVLMGFPASESGNPLLVPIAGHELGHTTWQTRFLDDKYGPAIKKHIGSQALFRAKDYKEVFEREYTGDLIDQENLAPAQYCAIKQCQETFCDFLGIRIFGASFLHAFAYLASPGGGNRNSTYPSLKIRVQNMVKAGTELSIEVPNGFSSLFVDNSPPKCTEKDLLLLDLADQGVSSLVDDLMKEAIAIADKASIPLPTKSKTLQIRKAFEQLTPAANIGDLVSIISAAWEMYYEKDLWKDFGNKTGAEREELRIATLSELILKSIEIMEFECRVELNS